ncbi:hypothetical protein N9406_05650 [Verrucomicrobiales bacterium]|nr:hypothetical protein [Verrucomicrobiales bacterium]
MDNPFAEKPTEPRKIPEDAPPQAIPAIDEESRDVAHHQLARVEGVASPAVEPNPADAPPTPIPDETAPVSQEETLPPLLVGPDPADAAPTPVDIVATPTSVSPFGPSMRVEATEDGPPAKVFGEDAPSSEPVSKPVKPLHDSPTEAEASQLPIAEELAENLKVPLTCETSVHFDEIIVDSETPGIEVTSAISGENSNSHHGAPPPLTMGEVSCRTCRFFHFEGRSRVYANEGECRCKSPAQNGEKFASWPAVRWETWCGEWVVGVSDEEMIKMARAVADKMTGENISGFHKKEDES